MIHPDVQDKGEGDTLTQSFSALSDPARRRLLVALKSHSPRTVDAVQSEEFRPDDVDATVSRIRLHHEHLPYLDESGLISWDRESNTIARGPNFEDLRPILACIQNEFDVDVDFEG